MRRFNLPTVYNIPLADLDMNIKIKHLSEAQVAELLSLAPDDADKREFQEFIITHTLYNANTALAKIALLQNEDKIKYYKEVLFQACLMLNPLIQADQWLASIKKISSSGTVEASNAVTPIKAATTKKNSSKVKDVVLSGKTLRILDARLKAEIKGQDEAVDKVVRHLTRRWAGLSPHEGPLGVFFFGGLSGTGKTHFARCLHNALYGQTSIVKINCGNYMEKHQAVGLFGAPASYVGYDNGGTLTEPLKKNPKAVVLLDEAEKGHRHMWDVFLEAFDEGFIKDSSNKTIPIGNTIFVITSNLGTSQLSEALGGKSTGFNAEIRTKRNSRDRISRERLESAVHDEMHKYFKTELVNRFDEVVVFNQLTEADAYEIAARQLEDLVKHVEETRKIKITYDGNVIDHLADRGYDTISGARNIKRVRERQIEDPMVDLLFTNEDIRKINISMQDAEFKIEAKIT